MKFAVVLLVLMPLALSASVDKRSILDFLGFDHLLDFETIRNTTQEILNQLGSDATLMQCQDSCHNFLAVDEGNLIHTLCTPLCRSFQTLVHLFHLTPKSR